MLRSSATSSVSKVGGRCEVWTREGGIQAKSVEALSMLPLFSGDVMLDVQLTGSNMYISYIIYMKHVNININDLHCLRLD